MKFHALVIKRIKDGLEEPLKVKINEHKGDEKV